VININHHGGSARASVRWAVAAEIMRFATWST
jgi:hypothetical protein